MMEYSGKAQRAQGSAILEYTVWQKQQIRLPPQGEGREEDSPNLSSDLHTAQWHAFPDTH